MLVLGMSANAFGSDWAALEAGMFRFRDPLNQDRRFVPLRLDDAPIARVLGAIPLHYCRMTSARRGMRFYSKLAGMSEERHEPNRWRYLTIPMCVCRRARYADRGILP